MISFLMVIIIANLCVVFGGGYAVRRFKISSDTALYFGWSLGNAFVITVKLLSNMGYIQ